jgi:hypothetical protein
MAHPPGLPVQFRKSRSRSFRLSDRVVQVAAVSAEFVPWSGEPLRNALGRKKVIASRGGPAFAELHIARLFEDAGWNARWVEPWARPAMAPAFLTEWAEAERDLVSLKGQRSNPIGNLRVERALEQIARRNGGRFAGVWDVLAWTGEHILFVESKLRGKDSIKETQLRWLEAALVVGGQFGIDASAFLIVEWCNSTPWPERVQPSGSDRQMEPIRVASSRGAKASGVSLASSQGLDGAAPRDHQVKATEAPMPARERALEPALASRAAFEASFDRYWRSLLKRFVSGEELFFAPRRVADRVGNRRRVVHMEDNFIHLAEEGPRGHSRQFDRGELETDFWKLSQDPTFDRELLPVLRGRHDVRYLVEFKRDMFEQFRSFSAS